MLTQTLQILSMSIRKIRQLRFALGIAGIAAAVAIAAVVLRGHSSSIAGVVVAVNMGVMLMIAILMFVAAAKSRGQAGKPYQRLYFGISCIFSVVLASSALLSLASVFFHWPLDFRETAAAAAVAEGDYRIEESVVVFDLRNRKQTDGRTMLESKEPKMRVDRVVRQRITDAPYQIKSGTNGLRIEQIVSPTHPSMTTEEIRAEMFPLTTKHSYTSSIPADRFPIGEPVTVKTNSVFVNAFTGDQKEWAGVSTDIGTDVITMIVLFPKEKPCKEVTAMQKPMGTNPSPYNGTTRPVLQGDGSMVTWTINKPSKGTGYFIAFKW
jgi:hypothetical protein